MDNTSSDYIQSQTYRQIWLFLALLLGSIAVGGIVAAAEKFGFILAIALVGAIWGVVALMRPMLLLCAAIVIAASVSALREIAIPVGRTTMTLSGLAWLMIAGLVLLYLLIHARSVQVPGYLWPFIAFVGWAGVRWLLTPTGFLGLKDLLWYSMPVLFGLFVPLALGRDKRTVLRNVRSLERVFLGSVFIPIALLAVALATGLAEMTWRGPRGELVGSARGMPLYLLVVLAVALANWRYGPLKVRGRLFSLLALGTILFTLGRMASFLGLMLLGLSRINPRRKWQLLGAGVVVAAIMLFAITHIPILQQRFFFTEDWDPSMGLKGINTAGRSLIWPTVYLSAMQSPILGHGLGVARIVTTQLFAGKKDVAEYHPHDEYLQIWHDMGVIGLFLVIVSWAGTFVRQWRRWEHSTRRLVAKWGMASVLALSAILISSLTDNTLHYPIVVVPAIIVISIESRITRMNQYGEED